MRSSAISVALLLATPLTASALATSRDEVSVAEAGASCGRADDAAALAAAVQEAAATGKGVLIDCPLRLTTSAGAIGTPVRFGPGGRIDVQPGGSVALNGPITADLHRIFSTSANPGGLTFNAAVPFVAPEWWGATSDPLGFDTDAVQAAIDAATSLNSKARVVRLTSWYRVNRSIRLEGVNDLLIEGVSSSSGVSAIPASWSGGNAILEIKDSFNIRVQNLTLDGLYMRSQDPVQHEFAAVWIHASDPDGGAQYIDLGNVVVRRTAIGYRFGNVDRAPDRPVSEINIVGGGTQYCPVAIEAAGTNTIVSSSSSQWTTSVAGWSARPPESVAIRAIGASVHVTGGTLYSNNGNTAALIDVQPIASPMYNRNLYGSVTVVGAFLETATQIARTSNPSALSAPERGLVSVIGSYGYVGHNDAPVFTSDPAFAGVVRIQGNNVYSLGAGERPGLNTSVSPTTKLYVDGTSFGADMRKSATVISGSLGRTDPSTDVVVDSNVSRASGNVFAVKNKGTPLLRADYVGNAVAAADVYAGDGPALGANRIFGAPYPPTTSSTIQTSVGFFVGPAVPSSGTWTRGTIVFNSEPDDGLPMGWVCVTSGSPGTWRSLASVPPTYGSP